MRKILAILLAMLMLIGSAALAEGNAAVLTVDNLSLQSGGQTINIQDLSASLVLENVNNLPSVALLIDGGGEALATAVAQLSTSKFSFAVDGMDHGYTADIPAEQAAQLAEIGDEGLATLMSLVPMLDQVELPAFGGIDIPKLDMTGILGDFMTGGNTFEIPYDQVNELLDQILQLVKSQGSAVQGLDEALQAVEQLKSSGMGVAIKGDIADDGATQTVSGGIFLAMNGTVTDQEIARLNVATSQNNFTLGLNVADMGDVLTASLVSDPDAAGLDFNLDVAGAANVAFALYSENGLQKAALNINAGGQSASLEFAYGPQDGADLVSFSGAASGASVSLTVATTKGADGVRTGSLVISANEGSETYELTGDVTMYTGEEIDLGGFTMPADMRSFNQIDSEAIGNAFAPVMDYIGSHATMG